jgi:hypothetical protein
VKRLKNKPQRSFHLADNIKPANVATVTVARCFILLLALVVTNFAARSEPLSSEVYVWQRAWTLPVREAVAEHSTNFTEIAVLQAEVSWKEKLPQVTRVTVDFSTLAKVHRPVGLVLRVGAFGGARRSSAEALGRIKSNPLNCKLILIAPNQNLTAIARGSKPSVQNRLARCR